MLGEICQVVLLLLSTLQPTLCSSRGMQDDLRDTVAVRTEPRQVTNEKVEGSQKQVSTPFVTLCFLCMNISISCNRGFLISRYHMNYEYDQKQSCRRCPCRVPDNCDRANQEVAYCHTACSLPAAGLKTLTRPIRGKRIDTQVVCIA